MSLTVSLKRLFALASAAALLLCAAMPSSAQSTGSGTITGVTTFRYAGDRLELYSADLGATARALYERAQR